MSDCVIEERFTPEEIDELLQGSRTFAFFTEAADWPQLDDFREDAEAAGLVTGCCLATLKRRHKLPIRLKALFIARSEGAWRFAKAAFVTRVRWVGCHPDIDWPDRMMAELIGRTPSELRAYLRRERRWWQIQRLKRRRKQKKRVFTPRSW